MDSKALLKLHDELAYFKSPCLFTFHFKPRQLFDLYDCLAALDRPDLRRLAARVEREMAAASRSVYVALKWLGFLHQLLQESQTAPTIERATETLGKLPAIKAEGNFEEYICSKLVGPYKQYLLKLAAIQLSKASQDFSPGRGREESGAEFCMFNLIAYSLQEFPAAIAQFSRYFQRFFPCLNEYIPRVGKDLRKLIRRIRISYEKGTLPTLNFLEVEKLEGDLSLFDQNAQRFTNSWIFPETNAQSF